MQGADEEGAGLFVLLPPTGFIGHWEELGPRGAPFIAELSEHQGQWFRTRDNRDLRLRVLDRIPERGPFLVEMRHADAALLQEYVPRLVIAPIAYAHAAVHQGKGGGFLSGGVAVNLHVLSALDDSPIPNAEVTVRVGHNDTREMTQANGNATIYVSWKPRIADRVEIQPAHGFWSWVGRSINLGSDFDIKLRPLDVSYVDARVHFYPVASHQNGAGVTVGIVDTGVGPHRELAVASAINVIPYESSDQHDNGTGHGSHIAGIIAGRAASTNNRHGIAPGTQIRSYRVCPTGSLDGSDYHIAKAIRSAVADGCDIINISMCLTNYSIALARAVEYAHDSGVLCVAAAGNDGRQPVAFPAAEPGCLAVSAMGRIGTFPSRTSCEDDVDQPTGYDNANFVARFSNKGHKIAFTAPGVGIISTIPGDRYAVKSGTSMACAAVTGKAACVLSTRPNVLKAPRTGARVDQLVQEMQATATPLGFGREFEGWGIL